MGNNIDVGSLAFRKRLTELRIRKGLTKQQLADKAGVTFHVVNYLELGKRRRAREETLLLIANALDTSFFYLVYGSETPHFSQSDFHTGTQPYGELQGIRHGDLPASGVGHSSPVRNWFGAKSRPGVRSAGFGILVFVGLMAILGIVLTDHGASVGFCIERSADQKTLRVLDCRSRKVLWEKTHSSQIEAYARTPWDGGATIVYGLRSSSGEPERLWVRRARSGEAVWSDSPSLDEIESVYGRFPELAGDFSCSGAFDSSGRVKSPIQFPDLDGDGESEMVVVFRHSSWFPSYVRSYSPAGEVLATYYLAGYLYDIHVEDMDLDGKDEVLIAGTNNTPSYQSGMITVLDARHGHGAAADSEALPWCTLPDSARVRVVLAKMDSTYLALLGTRRLRACHITTYRTRGAELRITVQVDNELGDALLVTLDEKLRPLSVEPSDRLISSVLQWPEDVRSRFLGGYLQEWLAGYYWFEARPIEALRVASSTRIVEAPPSE